MFATDSESSEGEVGGSVTLDSRAIFLPSKSGPCNFNQSARSVQLTKLENGSIVYNCFYDSGSSLPSPCVKNERFKVHFETSEMNESNAFNFRLEFFNLELNDTGTYEYEAVFYRQGRQFVSVSTITKNFNVTVSKSEGELHAILNILLMNTLLNALHVYAYKVQRSMLSLDECGRNKLCVCPSPDVRLSI